MRLKLETGDEVEAMRLIGSGQHPRPKCLLLHGNPRSIADWAELAPRLAGAADLAAIDLPGFGDSRRSDANPARMTLDHLADTAIAAADALDWRDPIILIGHSHGGAVAQAAAARHPQRVAGLVLIATLGSPTHLSYRALSLPGAAALARLVGRMFRCAPLRALNRLILRAVMSNIFRPEPVDAEQLERELSRFSLHPDILLAMVHVTWGGPSAQLLRSAPEIRCPTLFIHGSEDALVPSSCARAIHERIVSAHGRSRFHLVSGAGHMLITYQAAELASLISESFTADDQAVGNGRA
ncbi:MAG TPA: alpha/beta hydrolase [Polyangiaceae bacterium]|nr:alpha/beta hydrolase [Polyangiaceae bacterium]